MRRSSHDGRANPQSLVRARLFDVTDGVRSGFTAFTPSAKLAPDGRLWIATGKFAEVIDPSALDSQQAAIPVKVEELVADRRTLPLSGTINVPAATRDINIRYTALTSIAPQKAQFAYRLVGRDDDWQNVGGRRGRCTPIFRQGRIRSRCERAVTGATWSDSCVDLA